MQDGNEKRHQLMPMKQNQKNAPVQCRHITWPTTWSCNHNPNTNHYKQATPALGNVHMNLGFSTHFCFQVTSSHGTDRQTDGRARAIMWSIQTAGSYTVETFDADLPAGVVVQVVEQYVLPVTAVADKPKVRQRSFRWTNLLLHLA